MVIEKKEAEELLKLQTDKKVEIKSQSTSGLPENGTNIISAEESKAEVSNGVPVIYETLYKKGGIKGEFRFYHSGDLMSAVRVVKEYLDKRHLIHVHTMKFIIDLKGELDEQIKMGL